MQTLKSYYKELWGWEVISNNKGFIAYSLPEEGNIAWINELYIPENYRDGGRPLRDMANRVEKIAKSKEKIGVAANIILVNSSGGVHSNPSRILKIMLYWGFKIVASEKNVITLYKDIINDEKTEDKDKDNSSVQDKEK